MVRSAFGAQRGIGPGGGSANPKFSSAQTSALLPSCEKISLVRGDLHPPQQPLRFELQFGSLLGAKLDNARLMLKVSAGAVQNSAPDIGAWTPKAHPISTGHAPLWIAPSRTSSPIRAPVLLPAPGFKARNGDSASRLRRCLDSVDGMF